MKFSGYLLTRITTFMLPLMFVPAAYPCTWAVGHFHQVTRLQGTVVGVDNGDFRHPFRFLRLRVNVGEAKLTLYEYPFRSSDAVGNRITKQVVADEHGNFDFGPLVGGHYTLVITSTRGDSMFDVQVMQLQHPTSSITVDVSSNYPDCTGGHEFLSVSE